MLEEVRPGADCNAIFAKTLRLAKKLGYKDSYLGPPGLQTRFIGHGIGLELNELPFIAQGHSYPLEEGMTFAVEPKFVFPGEGAVGIENTAVVTKNGYEILTQLNKKYFKFKLRKSGFDPPDNINSEKHSFLLSVGEQFCKAYFIS